MTSKQRAYLRGLANTIDPVFQIGKGGITEEIIKATESALEARELIKLAVLETCEYTAKQVAEGMEAAIENVAVVQVIGRRLVLYKRSAKKPKIELPK